MLVSDNILRMLTRDVRYIRDLGVLVAEICNGDAYITIGGKRIATFHGPDAVKNMQAVFGVLTFSKHALHLLEERQQHWGWRLLSRFVPGYPFT